MRKLIVSEFLSLDGVMQAPGGPEEDPSDDFAFGGWQAPFSDDAAGEFILELNRHASAFLLGRRTFDIFRAYWPDQTEPDNAIATAINSLPKYVASRSLSAGDVTWRGEHPDTARLLTGDVVAAVRALKDEPGDELQVWGSGQQQVRNLWANIACWHLNLWLHTLGELWAWDRPAAELVHRDDSPWDDAARRPSHADRRKALQAACLATEFSRTASHVPLPPQIRTLLIRLLRIAI